jgi:hypothetical protein
MCKKPSHAGIMHPGPQGDDPCVYTLYLSDSKGIAGPNGEMVVTTSYDELVISDDDARLIAAAPELLVALGNLLATLEHADLHDGVCCCGDPMEGHSNPMDCGHSPVDAGQYYGSLSIAEAQAVIAKATGAA